MKKKLGASLFIRNGIKWDYCWKECLNCLMDLCDEIFVIDISTDGTYEALKELSKQNYRLNVVHLEDAQWDNDAHLGRERIAVYQNLGASMLSTDYYLVLQADEILHYKSFQIIRDAIEWDKEGFVFNRINFWQDANHFVSVPEYRQPCSTKVVRLGKTKYETFDDGESMSIPNPSYLPVYIYHVGFIRDKSVMKKKVVEMQEEVFRLGHHDTKLDGIDYFDSERWFKGDDLSEFKGEMPHYLDKYLINRP